MKEKCLSRINELCETVETLQWDKPYVYAALMAQTYYYVRYSTRLLARTASALPTEDHQLFHRFTKHISEEKGHEILAKKDVEALDYKLEMFDEYPSTKAFYQTQFYTIDHVSPYAFFGYILCLEGLAVQKGQWLYQNVKNKYGPRAGQFLKEHSEVDQEHLKIAFDLVESLNLDQKKQVFENLDVSCYLYGRLLQDANSQKNPFSQKIAG